MKKILITMLALCTCYSQVFAQAGALDPTFGVNNMFTPQLPNDGGVCYRHKVLSDGRIIGLGYASGASDDAYLFRLLPDGILDTTFGNMGSVIIDASIGANDQGTDIEILPSGDILIASLSIINNVNESRIIKLKADGSFDDNFGASGTLYYKHNNLSTALTNIEVDSEGRIVWAGIYESNNLYRWLILRLKPDGSFDNTFSSDGIQELVNVQNGYNEYLMDLCIASDNSIYLLGWNQPFVSDGKIIVTKLNTSGNIEIGYGVQGQFMYTVPQGIVFSSDDMVLAAGGELYIAGYEGDVATIIKVTPQGTLDTNFGVSGKVENANVVHFNSLKLFSAGKIAVLGNDFTYKKFMVAVYNNDGTLDPNFGNQGEAIHLLHPDITSAIALCIDFQPSGNMIVSGFLSLSDNIFYDYPYVVRLLNPGYASVDELHEVENLVLYPNPASHYFMVDVESGNAIKQVNLLDITGRSQYTWAGAEAQYNIPENISNGHYFIQIITADGVSNKSIFINNK